LLAVTDPVVDTPASESVIEGVICAVTNIDVAKRHIKNTVEYL
jgi:hypothetical protein